MKDKKRKTAKANRLALTINTQFVYSGQTGNYVGKPENINLVRAAFRLANQIDPTRANIIDPIWQSGNYRIQRIGRKLISGDLEIAITKLERDYLQCLTELSKALGITRATILSEYLNERQ